MWLRVFLPNTKRLDNVGLMLTVVILCDAGPIFNHLFIITGILLFTK